MRVLIVEDDVAIQDFLKRALVEAGFQVDVAGNAKAGKTTPAVLQMLNRGKGVLRARPQAASTRSRRDRGIFSSLDLCGIANVVLGYTPAAKV